MAKTAKKVREVKPEPKAWVNKKKSSRKMEVVNTKGSYFTPRKEGDFIEGEFVGIDRRVGGDYGTIEKNETTGKKEKVSYAGQIADVETGEVTTLPSTTLLTDFCNTIDKGTFIRITYLGKKTGKKGQEYHDYTLEKEEKPSGKKSKK